MEKSPQQFSKVAWTSRDDTATVLADWFAKKLHVSSVTVRSFDSPKDNGMSAPVYRLDIEWGSGKSRKAEKFVVRREPAENPVFYEADITKWSRAQQIIGEHVGTPVPKVYFIENDPTVIGGRFFAMKHVEGRIPPDRPAYHHGSWVTEISPEERKVLWRSAVNELVGIHRFEWRSAGLEFLRRGVDEHEIDMEVAYFASYCDWGYGRRTALVDHAVSWLMKNIPGSERLCLCWGDVRPSNMVFSADRLVGALDWELVSIGDPAKDLAWWNFSEYMFETALGLKTPEGCLSGRLLLATYEELSGASLENYTYYEVFNALRAVAIIARNSAILESQNVQLPPNENAQNNTATRALTRLLEHGRLS